MDIQEMNEQQLFNRLDAYRKGSNGSIAYLRIGKGLFYGKCWADYVDESGNRWYLKDKYYESLKDALIALTMAVKSSVPKK